MNAGSLAENNFVYGEQIGNMSSGSFVQSGGTHSIATSLLLGNAGSATGFYSLSAGSLAVPTLDIGNSSPGSFTQSGGTCSVTSELDEGVSPGSSGIYTLSGNGLLVASQEVIGDVTSGTVSQSGGTNTVANGLILGQNQGATGTYNLNGGLLTINGSLTVGDGSAALNMNGGTLSGGLVISGAGVLVLSGTNGYSGGTTVNSGKLIVLNSKSLLSGSNLTVGSSSSLYFESPTVPVQPSSSLQEVPEPQSFTLLGAGAIGILVSLRLSRGTASASIRRRAGRERSGELPLRKALAPNRSLIRSRTSSTLVRRSRSSASKSVPWICPDPSRPLTPTPSSLTGKCRGGSRSQRSSSAACRSSSVTSVGEASYGIE